MGYGAAAHVSFVYMLYHMDVIRVPKEETFSKKHTLSLHTWLEYEFIQKLCKKNSRQIDGDS